MLKYTVSREAQIDLEDIWYYTFETWSISQADKYVDEIERCFKVISENPESGRSIQNTPYKKHSLNAHFVIYHIGVDGLRIVRVLHQ